MKCGDGYGYIQKYHIIMILHLLLVSVFIIGSCYDLTCEKKYNKAREILVENEKMIRFDAHVLLNGKEIELNKLLLNMKTTLQNNETSFVGAYPFAVVKERSFIITIYPIIPPLYTLSEIEHIYI